VASNTAGDIGDQAAAFLAGVEISYSARAPRQTNKGKLLFSKGGFFAA